MKPRSRRGLRGLALRPALLANPAGINTLQPGSGLTLLHQAVLDNEIHLVRWLLVRQADGETPLQDRTPHGTTLLHRAASAGRAKVDHMVLSAGADGNAQAGRGETPVQRLARQGPPSSRTLSGDQNLEETVLLLLRHQASIDDRDAYGATPLERTLKAPGSTGVTSFCRHPPSLQIPTWSSRRPGCCPSPPPAAPHQNQVMALPWRP